MSRVLARARTQVEVLLHMQDVMLDDVPDKPAEKKKKTLKDVMKKVKTLESLRTVMRTENSMSVANRILLRCSGEYATQGRLTPSETQQILRLFCFLSAMVV